MHTCPDLRQEHAEIGDYRRTNGPPASNTCLNTSFPKLCTDVCLCVYLDTCLNTSFPKLCTMRVCVCIDVWIYVYVYVYCFSSNVRLNLYIHIYVYIYTYICICICMYVYVYIYIYISKHTCTTGLQMSSYIHTYNIHTYIHSTPPCRFRL